MNDIDFDGELDALDEREYGSDEYDAYDSAPLPSPAERARWFVMYIWFKLRSRFQRCEQCGRRGAACECVEF